MRISTKCNNRTFVWWLSVVFSCVCARYAAVGQTVTTQPRLTRCPRASRQLDLENHSGQSRQDQWFAGSSSVGLGVSFSSILEPGQAPSPGTKVSGPCSGERLLFSGALTGGGNPAPRCQCEDASLIRCPTRTGPRRAPDGLRPMISGRTLGYPIGALSNFGIRANTLASQSSTSY
jgi:hypothetical protein